MIPYSVMPCQVRLWSGAPEVTTGGGEDAACAPASPAPAPSAATMSHPQIAAFESLIEYVTSQLRPNWLLDLIDVLLQ
jgi:hypothetical protein